MSNNLQDPEWGTPVHPSCFHIFKQLSLERLGKVDIDGLRQLWLQIEDYCIRFPDFPEPPDVRMVSEQFYCCVPGTEYLVAHPMRIPGLLDLIQSCHDEGHAASDVVFATGRSRTHSIDPFAALSPELKLMLVLQLSRRDVANLRLSSRSFQQLSQSYFHRLVLSEMPWIFWDIETLPPKQIDWHKLWCRLSAADGGSHTDEDERDWLQDAEWPERHWNKLFDRLTPDELKRFGILPLKSGQSKVSDKQQAKMKDVATERKKAGRQWPKATELKGLRNRRRIYGDVQEIIRRIAKQDRERSKFGKEQ